MERIKLLNKRQNEAVEAIKKNGFIGTINATVGFGKNFVAFKVLLSALKSGVIQKKDKVLFFAETEARKSTLTEEIEKFKQIYNINLEELFNIDFYCYQSLPKVTRQVDIYDEIHDALTPKYKENLEGNAIVKIGLSATIPKNSNLYRDKIDYTDLGKVFQTEKQKKEGDITFINKGQLLEQLCPIVFTYTLQQGIEEELLSPYQTTIVEHFLDKKIKNIKLWKTKKQIGSEYDYYTKRASMKDYYKTPSYRKKTLGQEMCQLMYDLPSKVRVTKNLLKRIEGKTIVFGTRLEFLKKITPNVVEKKNFDDLVGKFNKDEIKVIASAKKLKQGITLKGIENCVITTYFSTFSDVIQQLGRIVRFSEGKVANLYIIVTRDTYDEKWFEQMQRIYDEKGKLISNINLNIVEYLSSKNLYD